MRCPNPVCHSNLQLIVPTQGTTNLECKECSYGMVEDIQRRALPPSSLLYPRPDYCTTLLWVFNVWHPRRWSDVLINVGIAKRIYATGMRTHFPDHEELSGELFENLNLMEYRLGDALECSVQSPKIMRSAWMQYIGVLDTMPPHDLSLQDVFVKGASGEMWGLLEGIHRFHPTTDLKEAFDEDRVVNLLESMIPKDVAISRVSGTSLFTEINARFEMLPHVAVEVFNKVTNVLAALELGPGASIATLWHEASGSN